MMYSAKLSTKYFVYTKARVCFHQFILAIHGTSAKNTFEKFIDAISMSSGLASYEF